MVRDLGSLENILCGGFGGLFDVIVGHPFDTIKVRLQSTTKYKGTIDCLRTTIKTEGFRGLYKGVIAPIITIAPVYGLLFYGYGTGRQIFEASREDYQSLRVFGAGCFSGIYTTIVLTPTERVKCLLQIQSSSKEIKYLNARDCVMKLYRLGGINSLFRGAISTAVREIPGNGFYFLTYFTLNQIFTPPGAPPSLTLAVFGGGLAGMVNWILVIPADVVKSRIQTDPDPMSLVRYRRLIPEIFKNKGVSGFFKGFVPLIARSMPANAACFLGFEIAAQFCRSFDK